MNDSHEPIHGDAGDLRDDESTRAGWSRLKAHLGFRKIGALYVWVVIIVLFTILAPDTFPTLDTARMVLNQNAVTGLVALGLVVPLSAGTFDLSIGSTIALTGIVTAWFLGNSGMGAWEASLLGIAVAVVVGVGNAVVVVVMGVDSFIGTLATGAIISAVTISVSGQQLLLTGGGAFAHIAQGSFGGLTLPVFYLVGVMLILGIVLQGTVLGRRFYATGFDAETARLAGVPIRRLKALSLVVSAAVAGFAGIVLASRLGAGSPSEGPTYLLPAFAAAFLGATQFQPGRFNAWGTVTAVLMIGTGQAGLLLVGAPAWAPNVFLGLVLIVAVSITGIERRQASRRRGRVSAKQGSRDGSSQRQMSSVQ